MHDIDPFQDVEGVRQKTERETRQDLAGLEFNLYQEAGARLGRCVRLRAERYLRLLHPLQFGHGDGRVDYVSVSAATGVPLSEGLRDQPLRVGWPISATEGVPEVGWLDLGTTERILAAVGCPDTSWTLYFWEGLGWREAGAPVRTYACTSDVFAELQPFGAGRYEAPTLAWRGRDPSTTTFVFTHPDATSTYVGTQHGLAERLLGLAGVDIVEVGEDTLLDTWTAA